MMDTETTSSVTVTPFQQIISACSGALLTSVLVNPLDVVKIRMQKQVKHGHSSLHDKTPAVKDKRICWMPGDLYKKVVLKRYVTPLDVVKVRLQAQQRPMTAGRCFIYCNGLMDHICTCEPLNLNGSVHQSQLWYAKPGRFSGTLDAFVKISRTEGVASLWSGLPPTLVMAVPATVVYFTLYDNAVTYLRNTFSYGVWMPMISGGAARIACVTLISPLEMIRTKLQSEKLAYKGLYWALYETVKKQLSDQLQQSKFTLSFISGAVAGSLAAFITCPFDVIKTHRQIEIGEKEIAKDYKSRPSSSWSLLEKLYKKEGIKALFAGLTPRIIKVAPACAIMIGTYEHLKICFKEHNRTKSSLQLGR